MTIKRELMNWMMCVLIRLKNAIDEGFIDIDDSRGYAFMMYASKKTFEAIKSITGDDLFVPTDTDYGIIILPNDKPLFLNLDESLDDPEFTIIHDLEMVEDEETDLETGAKLMSLLFNIAVTDEGYVHTQEVVAEYLDRFHEILAKYADPKEGNPDDEG